LQVCSYANPSQSAAISASLDRIPGIARIERIELPPLTRVEHLLATKARARFRQIVPAVDWVYLHSVWDPIIKAAGDVSHDCGKPYFLLPHGMLDPWSLAQKRWKKKIALATGYRQLLNRATAIQLLNADEMDLIRPLQLRSPSVVIPNGVFEEELLLADGAPTFLQLYPAVRATPFILFLGRLHQKKGLDLLADAFAIIAKQDAQVQLVVAGPEGNASADFDRRITTAGLRDRVHRVGAIYGDAKLAALKAATCFCLPSRQEGFSLAVTEALAMGVPVVITPGVHFPEVALAGAGEVVALEPQAVAAGLLKILSDPDERQRMSEAGKELVKSHYTWPRIAELSIKAYARLVGPAA
jgi:glycosyltransferase involved in cell wall biosynthesis